MGSVEEFTNALGGEPVHVGQPGALSAVEALATRDWYDQRQSFLAIDQQVLAVIIAKQGCKTTELAAQLAPEVTAGPLTKSIERLVDSGDLIEIEYTLPTMRWRVKSFLLPGETSLTVKGPAATRWEE